MDETDGEKLRNPQNSDVEEGDTFRCLGHRDPTLEAARFEIERGARK